MMSNMKNFEKKEDRNDKNKANEWTFQFSDIRSWVREIGLGWNTYTGFEKRYKESRQKCVRTISEKSSSELDLSYTTASSLTDDSYVTAIEDFQYWRRPSANDKSEISIDRSVNIERYKKNALISGLVQSTKNYFSTDEVFTDCSTDQSDTSNLVNDIHNEEENLNQNNNDINRNANTTDKEMFEDKAFTLFQSKEDEDVYVHPLREQIKEDRVWKEFRLSRKGIEVTATARQYYLNLSDKKFEIFEKVESKVIPKKKKVR